MNKGFTYTCFKKKEIKTKPAVRTQQVKEHLLINLCTAQEIRFTMCVCYLTRRGCWLWTDYKFANKVRKKGRRQNTAAEWVTLVPD